MELFKDDVPEGPVVSGFSGIGFRVGNRQVNGGLLLTPSNALDWFPPAMDNMDITSLAVILPCDPLPEFLLFGTGQSLVHPPHHFVREVEAMGLGIEVMDSKAAARAWGMLRQEDRQIVAAFMPLA
ncbi:Mth938-like domain-containing protein [Sphingorhabdus sp. Alg239-R122]|uniref:Mth938-like domain-containing protein n=1 Tax=Sphingorhabdus sp. Alg239-R122 TaxID=2305989 RepID=UPI001966E7EE|nr:Mth938-like domain-containing protein [Sphingorhabdus sp. Alg239-R122]